MLANSLWMAKTLTGMHHNDLKLENIAVPRKETKSEITLSYFDPFKKSKIETVSFTTDIEVCIIDFECVTFKNTLTAAATTILITPPEVHILGHFSPKPDEYAFGLVTLAVLTGDPERLENIALSVIQDIKSCPELKKTIQQIGYLCPREMIASGADAILDEGVEGENREEMLRTQQIAYGLLPFLLLPKKKWEGSEMYNLLGNVCSDDLDRLKKYTRLAFNDMTMNCSVLKESLEVHKMAKKEKESIPMTVLQVLKEEVSPTRESD
jgi:serine/threonine protein kinase